MTHDPKYPCTPGFYRNAPETSKLAAESVAEFANTIRAKVLAVVASNGPAGAIGDEVATALDLHVTQVRSRLSELVADKAIVDSERRRKGASGRKGAVWVLASYGPPPPADPQGDLLAAA